MLTAPASPCRSWARRRRAEEKGCGATVAVGLGRMEGDKNLLLLLLLRLVYSGVRNGRKCPLVAPRKHPWRIGVVMKIRKAGGPEWFVSASRGMFLCLDFGVALEPSKSDGGFSHGPPTGPCLFGLFFGLLATKNYYRLLNFSAFWLVSIKR